VCEDNKLDSNVPGMNLNGVDLQFPSLLYIVMYIFPVYEYVLVGSYKPEGRGFDS
jgi:hypothetical protein